jgi:hypothetical protein
MTRAAWTAFAAAIGVAAGVAVAVVVLGPLGEISIRTAFSAVAVAVAGATAIAGLALLDRRRLEPFGALVLVASLLFLVAMLYGVWQFEGDGDNNAVRWAYTGLLWSVATLVVATELLFARARALQLTLVPAVASATQVAAAFLTATLWSDSGHETWVKAFAAFGIVAFACWLATPVLERALRRPSGGAAVDPRSVLR